MSVISDRSDTLHLYPSGFDVGSWMMSPGSIHYGRSGRCRECGACRSVGFAALIPEAQLQHRLGDPLPTIASRRLMEGLMSLTLCWRRL